jgi:hypothetical protein
LAPPHTNSATIGSQLVSQALAFKQKGSPDHQELLGLGCCLRLLKQQPVSATAGNEKQPAAADRDATNHMMIMVLQWQTDHIPKCLDGVLL